MCAHHLATDKLFSHRKQCKHWMVYLDCLRQGLAVQPMLGFNHRSSHFRLLNAGIQVDGTTSAVSPCTQL